jgi:hypothetical protein
MRNVVGFQPRHLQSGELLSPPAQPLRLQAMPAREAGQGIAARPPRRQHAAGARVSPSLVEEIRTKVAHARDPRRKASSADALLGCGPSDGHPEDEVETTGSDAAAHSEIREVADLARVRGRWSAATPPVALVSPVWSHEGRPNGSRSGDVRLVEDGLERVVVGGRVPRHLVAIGDSHSSNLHQDARARSGTPAHSQERIVGSSTSPTNTCARRAC